MNSICCSQDAEPSTCISYMSQSGSCIRLSQHLRPPDSLFYSFIIPCNSVKWYRKTGCRTPLVDIK